MAVARDALETPPGFPALVPHDEDCPTRAGKSPRKADSGLLHTGNPEDVDGLTTPGPSWTVGDFMPSGFEAYAWLPNPIWVSVPPGTVGAVSDTESSGEHRSWKPMKWSEAAAAHGVTMTKDTEMHGIWGPPDPNTGRPVDPGDDAALDLLHLARSIRRSGRMASAAGLL